MYDLSEDLFGLGCSYNMIFITICRPWHFYPGVQYIRPLLQSNKMNIYWEPMSRIPVVILILICWRFKSICEQGILWNIKKYIGVTKESDTTEWLSRHTMKLYWNTAHSFPSYLCLLSCFQGRVEQLQVTAWPAKPKILNI